MAEKGLINFRIGSDGYAGIGQLLKSSGMKSLVEKTASEISGRAGSGYSYRMHQSTQRWNANIFPTTEETREDSFENNTLLKAMRSLRQLY